MLRPLLFLLFVMSSLFAKAYTIQQTDDTILEQVETIDKTEDDVYINPRESLTYDEDAISKTSFDKEKIEGYKNDSDFDYKEALPEDNWWTRFLRKLSDLYYDFFDWLLGGVPAEGIWSFVIGYLPYILLVCFIAFIIWVFFKIDTGSLMMEKIKAPETLLSDDEALIQRQDLQQLIDQALANNNYRLAVRFYYLLLLQSLTNKELIDWKVQKTNHDYIYEITDLKMRKQFIKVTDIYDYIWYGNFDVDKNAFTKAESTFKTLNNQI